MCMERLNKGQDTVKKILLDIRNGECNSSEIATMSEMLVGNVENAMSSGKLPVCNCLNYINK